MVSFDRRDVGTGEEVWLQSDRWGSVPALVLADITRLIVVSAHPDDETLGAGGLIARAAALGLPIDIVVVTDGEGSHPQSRTFDRVRLAGIRRQELTEAVAILAPTASVRFLGLPDARVREHGDELRERLSELPIVEGALVVAPWRGDRHGDHEVTGTIAAAVAAHAGVQFVEYPVWMWHWASPRDPAVPWSRLTTLQLSAEEQSAKAEALSAYISQLVPLSDRAGDESVLDDAFVEHFSRPFEVFVSPPTVASLTEHFFDTFYDGGDDPWGFETRWYEIRKRAITIGSLPRPLFASGLEIGCSIGVLTEQLAGRCARLTAIDIAEKPLVRARVRLAAHEHVSFRRGDATEGLPEGSFDLIVLSEVGYYWTPDDRERVIERIDAALTDDGVLVACHWRHPVDGYPEGGDAVHAALRAHPGFAVLAAHEEEDFLLDVLVRAPAVSVARETGLV